MNVNEAITGRSSVRDYTPKKVDDPSVRHLLEAAIHAPTAIHEEPWAFVVIQDKAILNRLSDVAKELLNSGNDPIHVSGTSHLSDHLVSPEFNTFYNATTLIVICAKPNGAFVAADCWLAAQNLMLAAYEHGLGTCVIGLAVTALNMPKWKLELGIPTEMTAFVPIIVGVPVSETPPVPRKPPNILSWTRSLNQTGDSSTVVTM
jgi:nitroreductase